MSSLNKRPPTEAKTRVSVQQLESEYSVVDDPKTKLVVPRGLRNGKSTRGKMPNWRSKMAYNLPNAASLAATALDWQTWTLNPASSSEYASLAALYDEVTVHGCEVIYSLQVPTAATSSPSMILGYDPLDVTNGLGSIAGGLVCMYNTGPMKATAGSATDSHPIPTSRSGHWKFAVAPKNKNRNEPAAVTATALGFGVFGVTTSSTVIWGVVKGHIEAGAAATVNTAFGYMVLDVEFRMRS